MSVPAPWPSPELLRWLADVLDRRRTMLNLLARSDLAASLRALADGALTAPEIDELRPVLALLMRSSLGTADVAAEATTLAPPSVAGVLDGVADPEGQFRPPAPSSAAPAERVEECLDPIAVYPRPSSIIWRRELGRILRMDRRAVEDLSAELALDGVRVPSDLVLDVPHDPEVAARLVAHLGLRFDEDGFGVLHASALRADEPASSATFGRDSGLVSSRVPTAGDVVGPGPAGVPRTVGRPDLVERLTGRLDGAWAPVQVVRGESGYGKSTVARVVAERVGAGDVTVLWLPARDLGALTDGLHRAAVWVGATVRQLEHALAAPGALRAERLWELLDESPRRWLAILEDAGRDAVGREAWTRPSPAGSVLITTRYGEQADWGVAVSVLDGLGEGEGARLLLDRVAAAGGVVTESSIASARTVARKLAGWPFALDRLGSAMVAAGGMVALTELAQSDEPDPLDVLGYVYDVCLRAIPTARRDHARRTLLVLAMLAPDEPLPVQILHSIDDDGAARTELVRVGLVEQLGDDIDGRPRIRLHRMVAQCATADPWHPPTARGTAVHTVVTLLDQELERLDPGHPSTWRLTEALEPHVAEVVEHPGSTEGALATTVLRMARRTASSLAQAGRQVCAETLLVRALTRLDAVGPRDRERLEALHTRAWIAAAEGNGDLAAVESELRSVLRTLREVVPAEDPSVLGACDTLAWVVAEQGRVVEAERALCDLLEIRTRTQGAGHRHTLTTRHRLAWVRALSGREGVALPEFEAVVDARRRLLGADHMHVFRSRYRHAWALNRLGRSTEATRLFGSLRDDLAAAVGRTHPMTLVVRAKCAWALNWTAEHAAATRAYEELLRDQEKVLGVDHPHTLATHHERGCLALDRGRLDEAVTVLRHTVQQCADQVGADHPRTLQARSVLGWAELQSGRAPLAYRMFLAVLADRARVLGPEHPATLISRHLVGRALLRQGRLAEAERLLRELVDDGRRILPPGNRNLLHARHSLGLVIALRARPVEAEPMLRDVLADRTRLLDGQHRETMVTRDVLTWLMGRTGRAVDALEICVQLLADRAEALGADHPHTLTSRYRQAWLTGVAGGIQESRALLQDLLGDVTPVLGPDHPDTHRCRMALVRAERRHGDLESALADATVLAADLERVQGAHAVDTLRQCEERGHLLNLLGRRSEARVALRAVLDVRIRVFGPDHPDVERGNRFLRKAE